MSAATSYLLAGLRADAAPAPALTEPVLCLGRDAATALLLARLRRANLPARCAPAMPEPGVHVAAYLRRPFPGIGNARQIIRPLLRRLRAWLHPNP